MNNSKKGLLLLCAGLFILALAGYQFFVQPSVPSDTNIVTSKESKSVKAQVNQSTAAKQQPKAVVAELVKTKERLSASDDPPKPGKKHYDDDWCIAKDELSETDYQFAQAELQDWNELQGKARARSPGSSYVDEFEYPNNNYLESYEALPPEQLQAIAVQGDNKWAMVAFVQHSYGKQKVKNEVAKKLLVKGASYYALEQLVISSLASATTSIRRNGATQEATDLVVDALAYAYWGLEQYNDGGLGPFVAITKSEPFKTKLPLDFVLTKSQKAIQDRINELDNWIKRERAEAGINLPEPTKAVQRLFAKNIAIRESISKEQIDLLRSLDITSNNRINNTPCVEKYLADIKSKQP